MLKLGLTARSKGHKQRKLKEHARVILTAFGLVTNKRAKERDTKLHTMQEVIGVKF